MQNQQPLLSTDLKRDARFSGVAFGDKSLTESVAAYEARLIRQALEKNDWNRSQAARQLRLPVQTLHYKMIKLGIVKF